MPTHDADQRHAVRLDVNQEFSSVQDFLHEYVTNISRTGVFIRTDQPLPIGTRVELRFTVILGELETVEGVGEVVRVEHGGEHGEGMGVRFIELRPDSQAVLDRLFRDAGVQPPAAAGPDA